MFSFFKLSPTKIRAQQLHDNQVSLLQHKQAAAYHQAMSLYLQGEVGRLSADVEAEKVAASLPTVAPEWVKTEMRSKGFDQEATTAWADRRVPKQTRPEAAATQL